MCTVENYDKLADLKNISDGELVILDDTHQVYQFKDNKWIEKDMNEESKKLTLYGLNKLIVAQMPSLTTKELGEKKKLITDFVTEIQGKYYLLLSKELNYYTLFAIQPSTKAKICDELIQCLFSFGRIKSIDLVHQDNDSALECWVCDRNNNASVFYFFDWTEGTIECK